MPRPENTTKPLMGYTGAFEQTVRSIDLIKAIVKNAINEKMWVFDPSTKRWFTPEEFMEMYERYDNIDTKWLYNIQVLDPTEGLEAADQQIESILARRRAFAKRIVDYWKNKRRIQITSKSIIFQASYGDVDSTVEISFVSGGNGTVYLMIDRYFFGQFCFRQGKWALLLQDPESPELTLDDMQILCDILNEAVPEP